MNIEKKIRKANKKLAKIIMYFKKNNEKFGYTNYKMYEACFYDFKTDFPLTTEAFNDDSHDLFYEWCDESFRMFEEWIEEEGISYEPDYIGRTSSFKVHKDIILNRWNDVDIAATITNLYDDVLYGYIGSGLSFTDEGLLDKESIEYMIENEYINELCEDLDYIIKDFFKDIKKHFEDSLKVRDYIDDTKENQVEYFKEWLQFHEDMCEYARKEEHEEEQIEYISRTAWLKTFSIEKENVLERTYLSSDIIQELALAH